MDQVSSRSLKEPQLPPQPALTLLRMEDRGCDTMEEPDKEGICIQEGNTEECSSLSVRLMYRG